MISPDLPSPPPTEEWIHEDSSVLTADMEEMLRLKVTLKSKEGEIGSHKVGIALNSWVVFYMGYPSTLDCHCTLPTFIEGEQQTHSPTLDSGPNYYNVLGLPQDATERDIIRAWRRAVLLHHPDKQAQGSAAAVSFAHHDGDIRLINEAKWVLGDEQRRKEWEETYFSSNHAAVVIDTTPHVSYNISLSAFTPHYRSTEAATLLAQNGSRAKDDSHPEEENGDDEPIYYIHPCRCSSEFVITYQDLEDGIEVVGCGGCGEWVRVGYEVVDEEEEVDEE